MQHELHEAWLEALDDPHDGTVPDHARGELESCPECAGKLQQSQRLQRALARAASEQREVFAAAAAMKDAPGVARAQALLRQSIPAAPTATSAPVRKSSRRAWIAAAAVLIGVVSIVVWRANSGGPSQPEFLGPGEKYEAIAPIGHVDHIDAFEWRGRLPPHGWFVVQVFAPGERDPAVESSRITTNTWRPDANQLKLIPAEFEWRVKVNDGSDAPPRFTPSVSGSWP